MRTVQLPVIIEYDGIRLWEDDLGGLLAFGLADLQEMVKGENLTPVGEPRTRIIKASCEQSQPTTLMVFEVDVK